jgi:hypothetical protein
MPKTLTAACVDAIFAPILSEDGCRIGETEELVIMHWRDYLQEREGNYMIQCQCDVEKVPMSHMRTLYCVSKWFCNSPPPPRGNNALSIQWNHVGGLSMTTVFELMTY